MKVAWHEMPGTRAPHGNRPVGHGLMREPRGQFVAIKKTDASEPRFEYYNIIILSLQISAFSINLDGWQILSLG